MNEEFGEIEIGVFDADTGSYLDSRKVQIKFSTVREYQTIEWKGIIPQLVRYKESARGETVNDETFGPWMWKHKVQLGVCPTGFSTFIKHHQIWDVDVGNTLTISKGWTINIS